MAEGTGSEGRSRFGGVVTLGIAGMGKEWRVFPGKILQCFLAIVENRI